MEPPTLQPGPFSRKLLHLSCNRTTAAQGEAERVLAAAQPDRAGWEAYSRADPPTSCP